MTGQSTKIITFLFVVNIFAAAAQGNEDYIAALRSISRPLPEAEDALIERLARAKMVLMGEASHGTSEYYTKRAEYSRRLITGHGFNFVAVEGDWNSIYKLNEYVHGKTNPAGGAREIMRGFTRWPLWMWANEEFADFVEWLREYNQQLPPEKRAGVYGMDVYGMEDALQKLPDAVGSADADLGSWISEQYAVFNPFIGNMHAYARVSAPPARSPGREPAAAVIERLREHKETFPRDQFLHFEMMALVVVNAEAHYRTMALRDASSWNNRARHFFEAAKRLMDYYGEDARGIAWAHNTHIGDARATDMARSGQFNIGQLARQHWGAENVAALGFGTHKGTVMAGREWGGQREIMRLPEGISGSLEDFMRQAGDGDQVFFLDDAPTVLNRPIGHRAAGVIYHPEREHMGNYVRTILPQRYDVFVFIEETQTLAPVD